MKTLSLILLAIFADYAFAQADQGPTYNFNFYQNGQAGPAKATAQPAENGAVQPSAPQQKAPAIAPLVTAQAPAKESNRFKIGLFGLSTDIKRSPDGQGSIDDSSTTSGIQLGFDLSENWTLLLGLGIEKSEITYDADIWGTFGVKQDIKTEGEQLSLGFEYLSNHRTTAFRLQTSLSYSQAEVTKSSATSSTEYGYYLNEETGEPRYASFEQTVSTSGRYTKSSLHLSMGPSFKLSDNLRLNVDGLINLSRYNFKFTNTVKSSTSEYAFSSTPVKPSQDFVGYGANIGLQYTF